MDEKLIQALVELREEEAVDLARRMMAEGVEPLHIVDVCRKALSIVGERYERREYYLSGLIMSGEIFRNIVEMLEQSFSFPETEEETRKVILGAPLGDVHDIGKNIVAALLRAAGYDVTDLGRDVPVDEVIEAVLKEKPILLTGTALMTTTMYAFKEINDKLLEKGLKMPFACGGGAVNQDFVAQYDLGVYGEEASDAVKIADAILANGNDIEKLRAEFHKH